MKLKPMNLTSQLLILLMAALVLGLMVQFAQAQSMQPMQNSAGSGGQVLQINMPQKSFHRRLLENTSLTYYQQFLGPTAAGTGGQTYNVFQDARAPYQSFHTLNLRHQINNDWAVGATLAAVNAYGTEIKSNLGPGTMPRDSFFNARFYVTVPSLNTRVGSLFTTIAYEAPTSVDARNSDMRYGAVLTQSFAFNLPSFSWSGGLMWQYYRSYYKSNMIPPPFEGASALPRQTTIVSGGPYVNYRFSDRWMVGSLVTFDWDQRGNQSNTTRFNNNLPDRVRSTVTYNPPIKYISAIGVFTQNLIKYTPQTQAFGAEMTLRF